MTTESSGASPRFPVWEVVILIFILFFGITGILHPSPRAYEVLGPNAVWWFIGALLSGIFSLTGLWMKVPNGFVVNFIGTSILCIVSLSFLVGLIVYTGNPLFTGATSLYTFAIGGGVRSIQLIFEMRRIQHNLHVLNKRIEDGDGS